MKDDEALFRSLLEAETDENLVLLLYEVVVELRKRGMWAKSTTS